MMASALWNFWQWLHVHLLSGLMGGALKKEIFEFFDSDLDGHLLGGLVGEGVGCPGAEVVVWQHTATLQQ